MSSELLENTARLAEIYRRGLRSLLWRTREQPLCRALELLEDEAALLIRQGAPPDQVYQQIYARVRVQTVRRLFERHAPQGAQASTARRRKHEQLASLLEEAIPTKPRGISPDFHCDAALGGLARWLRAAGYDAAWWPDIEDAELVRKALASSAIMLTTDRRLMEQAAAAKGLVAALLVPVSLDKRGQFAFVARALELPPRAARCMACGGRLAAVDKESVRNRIPPRTCSWRDDYFVCELCDRLYWEGTHWQKIGGQLDLATRPEFASELPQKPARQPTSPA